MPDACGNRSPAVGNERATALSGDSADQFGDGRVDADARGAFDEVALIQAAQRDLAAFGSLYARHVDRIYSYLLSRTGPARAEDAADLTQQVFVRALDALPRYQPRAGVSVAAWLFRIARNAATDWQRRQRSSRRIIPWQAVPEAAYPSAPETAEGAVLLGDE